MAALGVGACAEPADVPNPSTALDDDSITVGSFDFAESVLLAEIYSQSLEHVGFTVERAFALGPREFVAPALAVGLIELVPEYVGSAATFVHRGQPADASDLATSYEQLVSGLTGRSVAALTPSPAQNANAFVVAKPTAEAMGLRTLSDVAAVADDLVFGGPPECQRRVLCLVGLAERYGVTFETVVSLRAGPLIEQALRDGGIDVGLMFTSDAAMLSADFVELRDDRGLQPAENITPLVREEALDRWGGRLVDAVDSVSARLTTEGLRQLNADVAGDTARVAAVATGWLEAQGLT
ncbi:MAG TPA: ABC transporter substrate-binding protein [Ilumatobacteraceae bacterium]|nr:ABC transporter substrate-binding protein [Ilumatobacteraceae bacterium]